MKLVKRAYSSGQGRRVGSRQQYCNSIVRFCAYSILLTVERGCFIHSIAPFFQVHLLHTFLLSTMNCRAYDLGFINVHNSLLFQD